jgi:uncharacterized protein with GYD domain
MASYLTLLSWTEQGIRNVQDGPARLDAAKQRIEAAGGRMIFCYLLMGEHDMAVLTEFPDDETATRFLLETGRDGNVRSHTMKAFTEDEYRGLVGGLS